MHVVVVGRPELAGRRAQSLSEESRSRRGTGLVVAVRLGELVKKAMFAVEKPW